MISSETLLSRRDTRPRGQTSLGSHRETAPRVRLQKSEPEREAESGIPLIPRRRPPRSGFWETGSEALAFPYPCLGVAGL